MSCATKGPKKYSTPNEKKSKTNSLRTTKPKDFADTKELAQKLL